MNKIKTSVVERSLSGAEGLVETTLKMIFIILILSFFLSSCTSNKNVTEKTAENLRPVYITNSKKVNLLMPSHAAAVFEGLQLLNGSFGASSFTLLSYTQIDASGISLFLLNDFGTDMGNVFFDGQQVIFDSAYFPKALPGEYIICDIQNAYYDEGAVRKNLESAGLKFEVSREAGSQSVDFAGAANLAGTTELAGVTDSADLIEVRKILDGKKVIEEITILKNTIKIKNYLRGYEYNLTLIEE